MALHAGALLALNIRLALHSLWRHRLRTFLTMLGIIIGVAAVLTLIAVGAGARTSVQQTVASAGTNLVYVKAGNYTRGGQNAGITAGAGAAETLTADDWSAIDSHIPGIQHTTPEVTQRTFIVAGEQRAFGLVHGTSAAYAAIFSWQIDGSGRMFRDDSDDEAVIGRTLADTLFGVGNDPLGQLVRVRETSYRIVGVLRSSREPQLEDLFVPWRSLQSSLEISHLHGIVISAEKAGDASRVATHVRGLLRERHGIGKNGSKASTGYLEQLRGVNGEPDDFLVETQAARALTQGLYTSAAAFALANLPNLDEVTLSEMADTLDRASSTMAALLASLAGISLLVGGTGITNVMLVSIAERTREIGVRLSVGAKRRDVTAQFLVEAVTLSALGGLAGIGLGMLSTIVLSSILRWPAAVSLAAIALVLGIALLVGLAAGLYPAWQASRLDPVEALKSE